MRARIRAFVEASWFQTTMIVLIIVNAGIMGIEVSMPYADFERSPLAFINQIIIGIFVVEILLRLFAHGWAFFKSGWNIFDFVVVAAGLIPASSESAILRLFRLLRVFRLLSAVRAMRLVVNALGRSMPGIVVIGGLFFMVVYVFAIASTILFRALDPAHFGNLGLTFAALYRLVMGDGWPDIVAPMASEEPWIWAYFIGFTLVTSIVLLNLFVAVIVEAMDRVKREEEPDEETQDSEDEVLAELRALRAQVSHLEHHLYDSTKSAPHEEK